MKTTLRLLRTMIIVFCGSGVLTGCGIVEPLRDAVVPDFSDEQLGNPMATFVPSNASSQTMTAPRPGLAFSATSPVGALTSAVQPTPTPTMATGLIDQAASTGLTSADAALLDAALDVSPSQMGLQGAAVGLVPGSIDDLIGFNGGGGASPVRAPILTSLDATETGFQVLSTAEVEALMAEGGAIKYTSTERADLQTPYFDGRADALTGFASTPGFSAVGTSPEVAVNVPEYGSSSFGDSFDADMVSAAVLRTNQAVIPIYGGSQRLAQQPTSGTYRPGFAQFRSGAVEFTLTYPSQVAVTNLYGPNSGSATLTLRNLDSLPVTFQPENLLNRFPPFEIFRWTGTTWASLTLDVAYNLDRQGIAAPVVLQPGQSTTRRETLAKLALLPLTVDLPPTQQLALRLRVLGQGDAFGNVDSGYLPIRVTDSGGFPTATNLTTSEDPGFVVLDGSQGISGTFISQ